MNANVKIPESLEELCDYIEEVATRREKIKAVSTKYSEMWTDIGGSDGIVIFFYISNIVLINQQDWITGYAYANPLQQQDGTI